MSDDDLPPDLDLYAFLSVPPDANDSQIRKSYRKQSLLYHPDKNPSPTAALKFHHLKLALDILLSPSARVAYDNVRKAKAAKKERTAKYDSERRRMQVDLESREKEAKRRKTESGVKDVVEEERVFRAEVEKLREESARLKRERDRRMQQGLSRPEESEEKGEESERTVKVRFRKGTDRSEITADRIQEIFTRFGDIENVILGKAALVVFSSVSEAKDAIARIKEHDDSAVKWIKEATMSKAIPSQNVDSVKTAPAEPANPLLSRTTNVAPAPSTGPKFSFNPAPFGAANGADYESITLMRMKKLEREKLEREIREQEALEEVNTF
jgi:DnaJ homolog subfamily C member 17